MNPETQHPTLVIQGPDGTIVKIYQELSLEYIKELLDNYLLTEKLVK